MTSHPRRGSGKITSAILSIASDGQEVRATNYWATDHARRGYCYLSVNAGALRLLIPHAAAARIELDDLRRADRVGIQIIGARHVGAIHIVWEDDSDSPPYLTLDARQCDRVLPREEAGRWVTLITYLQGDQADAVREAGRWPALLREASRLISSARVPRQNE